MNLFKKILSYVVYIAFAAFIIVVGLGLIFASKEQEIIYEILGGIFFGISIIALIILFVASPNVEYNAAKKLYKQNKDLFVNAVKSCLKEENMELLLSIVHDEDYIFKGQEQDIILPFDKNKEKQEDFIFLVFSLVIRKNFVSHSIKSLFSYAKNGYYLFKAPYQNTKIVDLSIKSKNLKLNKYIMNATREEDLNFDWRSSQEN